MAEPLDKAALRDAFVAELQRSLQALRASAKETRRGATHAESRAENDKDTRGLEASYLARGQAARVAEVEVEAKKLRFMTLPAFGAGDAVGLGAVITLEMDGESPGSVYFLTEVAGGTRIEHEGREVLMLSPTSPLARALLGKRAGDELELRVGKKMREVELISVE